jgi:hypothetical protein
MAIGDRQPAGWRRWIHGEKELVTEPLHTDDPTAEGNLSSEDYRRLFEERAASIGADGLHVVPQEILDSIERG